jgi:hypothetical protein
MRSSLAQADAAHARECAAHGQTVRAVAELLRTDEWKGRGARDLASFLAARWQKSRRETGALVREALALRERPEVLEALCAGEISVDQGKALAHLDNADVWLENIAFVSITELEREARKTVARELERRDDGVYLRTRHTDDERYLRGEFQVHPEDGAVIINAIDALVPSGVKLREYDHAAAKALVALARGERCEPATVVLSVEATDDVASLATGGFVSPQTAARLSCDSRMQVGERTSRTIPANLRRAVEVRDHGACVFPECGMTAYLEVHHIVPIAQNGPTVLSNLVLLCWNHHNLVHEQHWSLVGDAGPHITWVRPDGTIFEPRVRVDTS